MAAITLSQQARAEFAEAIEAINVALLQSSYTAKLYDLSIPALLNLVVDAQGKDSLVERLLPVRFISLLRAARAAVSSEEVADRLLALGFPKVLGVLESELTAEKMVSKLSMLRFQSFVDLLEKAAANGRLAGMLGLFGFAEWVDLLASAIHAPALADQVARLDFHRLWRAATVALGLERVAANGEGLNPSTVLRHSGPARAALLSKSERLAGDPYGFDFYWALRCLQVEQVRRPKIGAGARFADDFLRLRQEPDLRFAASTLREFVPGRDAAPAILSVNFLGLWGPNGALPIPDTEHALARLSRRDESIARFADVFHHRALSLFFRCWAVHQKAVDLDRAEDRRFANYVASFHGLGQPTLRDRDAVPDMAKLYFSGRLAPIAKNPEGLESILSEFFGIPCEVHNFHGHWITIPKEQVCSLGSSPDRCSLGITAIVGSQVYQYQTKFRLRLGPMRFETLTRLLPINASWRRLKAWVRNYIGDELLWDAQYVLLASEVPATQLGGGGLLGWTTWITTRTPDKDAEDVIIDSDLH